MQDHSHRLLFLGATGLMCAAAVYGSQAGPALLLPPDRSASSIETLFEPWTETQGIVRQVSFQTSETAAQTDANLPPDAAQQPGTASVVPNNTSCPAADAAALVSPPSVNGVIGSPTPLEKTALPRQGLAGASLGTGSSCPPARGDALVQKIPAAGADASHGKAAAALPGAISRP